MTKTKEKENEKSIFNPVLFYFILMFIFPFILGLFNIVDVDYELFTHITLSTDYAFILFLIFFVLEGVMAFLITKYTSKISTFGSLMACSFIIKALVFAVVFLISGVSGVIFENFTIGSLELNFSSAYYALLFARMEIAKVGGLITYIPTLICLPTILGYLLGRKKN